MVIYGVIFAPYINTKNNEKSITVRNLNAGQQEIIHLIYYYEISIFYIMAIENYAF